MPGQSGPGSLRIPRRAPGLRTLFISGYSRDHVVPEMARDLAFLAKPFTYEELLEAVSALLAGPARGQSPGDGAPAPLAQDERLR